MQSKYDRYILPNFDIISKLKRDGLTERQIAEKLSIGYSTWCRYKTQYREFNEVLLKDDEYCNAKSERTLMQMAWGEHPNAVVTDEEWILDKRTGKMILLHQKIKKDTRPNMTALIFLMKNKDPEHWRDRRDVNVNSESVIDKAMENFKLVSDELAKNAAEEKDDE